MGLNLSTLTPASLKSKNVATEEYVDSGINNLTKVEDIAWQSEVQAAINNNATTIDGGKIVTNTLYGDRLIANTVSADRLTSSTGTSTVWTGGGLVSQNFNGNPVGGIGSPTQGFRLSSGAAGTSTDPNIYGAYIKGSTLEAINMNIADIKVTTAFIGKTGPIFRTIMSGSFHGPNYGTGYLGTRIVSRSTSRISILANWKWSAPNSKGIDAYLQYSINDGAWVTFESGHSYTPFNQSGTGTIVLSSILIPTVMGDSDYISFRVTGTYSAEGTYGGAGSFYTATLNNML